MTDETTPIVTQSPSYLITAVRLFLHGIFTLCGAIMTGLAGTNWAACDGQTKFLIVVGITATVSGAVAAFFDKTFARMSEGKAAIATGNTNPPIPIAR